MESKENKIGFFGLLTMGIGYIIGSGVFTMLPSVLGMTGRSVCFSMLAGAIICILMTIPTVFLSSVKDLNGGTYSQYLALFPPVVAGVFGIAQNIAVLSFGSTAIGLATYTLQLFPGADGLLKAVAMGYLVLFFLLGVRGVTLSTTVQNVMVGILLVALGIYIVMGLPNVQPGFFETEGFFAGGLGGFLSSTALLSMSAMGATALINFTSVAKNPQRTIPMAMVISTALVAGFYFLIAIVTAGVLPIEQVAGKNLGVVAEIFMPKPIYLFFMVGGALFALGTTLNASLASLSYPWVKMAEDGWLPKILAKRDKKYQYPYVFMGCVFVVAAVLPVMFGLDIATIATLFSFPSFVVNTIASLATLRLIKLFPEAWAKSKFKVPAPIFYILVILSTVAFAFLSYSYIAFLDTKTVLLVLVAIAVLSAYAVWRYKAGYVKIDVK